MEVTGYVHKVLDPVTGETEKGVWTRRGLVITPISSDRELCFEFSGEDWAERLGMLSEGDLVKLLFVPVSSEYEGKWYTRLKGFGMQVYEKKQ